MGRNLGLVSNVFNQERFVEGPGRSDQLYGEECYGTGYYHHRLGSVDLGNRKEIRQFQYQRKKR